MVVQHSIANGQLIYVVDNDATISQLVAVNLQARGYRVRRFDQGAEVLTSVETDEPALMVLDIIMPGINGLVLAREVRRLSQVPILMLSVRDEISPSCLPWTWGRTTISPSRFGWKSCWLGFELFCVEPGSLKSALPLLLTASDSSLSTWNVTRYPATTGRSS